MISLADKNQIHSNLGIHQPTPGQSCLDSDSVTRASTHQQYVFYGNRPRARYWRDFNYLNTVPFSANHYKIAPPRSSITGAGELRASWKMWSIGIGKLSIWL